MVQKKVNYGEYMVLGINKAMLAFLISFVLCLGLSLVINLHFYEELIALTVGGLGEAGNAESATILKTTALLLGLSSFQVSGKFQIGLLLLGIIPVVAFWISGRIFRRKGVEDYRTDLWIGSISNGLAALLYAVFMMLSNLVARGELFGININFLSVRNFVFTFVFALFIQFFSAHKGQDSVTVLAAGLLWARKLLRFILSFSALSGILFILYYVTPYIKGVLKIAVFVVVLLPNLAVYLSFLLMGIPLELGGSFQQLTGYLPSVNWNAFMIPLSIRVALLIGFLLLILILLVRIPVKQYWQNLSVFVISFSVSMSILAVASRIHSGFQGALNIHFEIPLWKVFLAPFVLIWLDGILLALLRMLCREVKGENATGIFAAFLYGLEAKSGESLQKSSIEEDAEMEAEEDEEDEDDRDGEIDIWKELAARPIPGTVAEEVEKPRAVEKKPLHENFFAKSLIRSEETSEEINSVIQVENKLVAEEQNEDLLKEARPLKTVPEPAKAGKEIDISLFPRKKKSVRRGFMDFSDMEDDILVDEYEAEETLEEFADAEDLPENSLGSVLTENVDLQPLEETRVVKEKRSNKETWEETIPYQIIHRK